MEGSERGPDEKDWRDHGDGLDRTGSKEPRDLILSSLPHTWLVDIDGTIVVHNGYLQKEDILLDGSAAFLRGLPEGDRIVLLTSRDERYREQTERFLKERDIRYNTILFGLPMGERILINDDKPSGLCMSYAVRLQRDAGIQMRFTIDSDI